MERTRTMVKRIGRSFGAPIYFSLFRGKHPSGSRMRSSLQIYITHPPIPVRRRVTRIFFRSLVGLSGGVVWFWWMEVRGFLFLTGLRGRDCLLLRAVLCFGVSRTVVVTVLFLFILGFMFGCIIFVSFYGKKYWIYSFDRAVCNRLQTSNLFSSFFCFVCGFHFLSVLKGFRLQ